jgi:Domain of unknown function (DUF4345)
MATRIFLGVSALVWLPYGLYCFLSPEFLAGAVGIVASTATASTELRAMYGGLQMGIGMLAGAALLAPSLRRPALLALAFLCTGLATTRALGVALDGGLSSYTVTGLAFEIVSASLAVALLPRTGLIEAA